MTTGLLKRIKNTSVKFPNSLKWISESAFEGCENLSSVEFANETVRIDCNSFKNCTSLSTIIMPDGTSHKVDLRSLEGSKGNYVIIGDIIKKNISESE